MSSPQRLSDRPASDVGALLENAGATSIDPSPQAAARVWSRLQAPAPSSGLVWKLSAAGALATLVAITIGLWLLSSTSLRVQSDSLLVHGQPVTDVVSTGDRLTNASPAVLRIDGWGEISLPVESELEVVDVDPMQFKLHKGTAIVSARSLRSLTLLASTSRVEVRWATLRVEADGRIEAAEQDGDFVIDGAMLPAPRIVKPSAELERRQREQSYALPGDAMARADSAAENSQANFERKAAATKSGVNSAGAVASAKSGVNSAGAEETAESGANSTAPGGATESDVNSAARSSTTKSGVDSATRSAGSKSAVDSAGPRERTKSAANSAAQNARSKSTVDSAAQNARSKSTVDSAAQDARPKSAIDSAAQNARPKSAANSAAQNARSKSGVDSAAQNARSKSGVDSAGPGEPTKSAVDSAPAGSAKKAQDGPRAWYRAARSSSEPDEALRLFDRVAETNNPWAELASHQAIRNLMRRKMWREASKRLTRARTRFAGSQLQAELHLDAITCALALGNLTVARAEAQRFVDLFPKHPRVDEMRAHSKK